MSKKYMVNSDCKIKQLNDDKALVQIEGTMKLLECDYNILTDVISIISNGGTIDDIQQKYSETFGKEVVNKFLETLLAEKILTVYNDSVSNTVRVLIVGNGLICDYLSAAVKDKFVLTGVISPETPTT